MNKRYDIITEVKKANPYHDERGRFTTKNGGGAGTINEDANPEYRYHSTSWRSAYNIQSKGAINPSNNAQYGKGVYFAPNVEGTKGWTSEENEKVQLRVKTSTLKEKYEYGEFPDQGWTENKPVRSSDVEIKVGENKWVSIDDVDIRPDFEEIYEW